MEVELERVDRRLKPARAPESASHLSCDIGQVTDSSLGLSFFICKMQMAILRLKVK